MKQKIKNLRKILVYSDPEPTELLVGLISLFMIPLFLWRNEINIATLYLVFAGLGLYQICSLANSSFCSRQRACLFTMAAYMVMFLSTTTISVYLSFPIGYEAHWLFLALVSFWNLKRVSVDNRRYKRKNRSCPTKKK